MEDVWARPDTVVGLLGAGDDPQREDAEKDPDRRGAPWYNRCRIAAGRSVERFVRWREGQTLMSLGTQR